MKQIFVLYLVSFTIFATYANKYLMDKSTEAIMVFTGTLVAVALILYLGLKRHL